MNDLQILNKLMDLTAVGATTVERRELCGDRELVSISVVNNRFCWHVGRRHKSNNIYFQITPATFSFCQKCYDTDCRGATSPLFPIPVRFF